MFSSLRRISLFLAFAFTVMADPVSSVAYAIESALRSLDGNLASLLVTMAAIVAVVSATYHDLIGRFPSGGGGPEGVASAFGEGWSFIPLGALLVDFTLTRLIRPNRLGTSPSPSPPSVASAFNTPEPAR